MFYNVNGLVDNVISERLEKIVFRNDNDMPDDEFDEDGTLRRTTQLLKRKSTLRKKKE